jgi:hypothetical protein
MGGSRHPGYRSLKSDGVAGIGTRLSAALASRRRISWRRQREFPCECNRMNNRGASPRLNSLSRSSYTGTQESRIMRDGSR